MRTNSCQLTHVLADQRLALICDLLDSFEYKGKDEGLVKPDRDVVFPWSPEAAKKGLLAH